jgi:tetratricopeptide (TPR) repeat protein
VVADWDGHALTISLLGSYLAEKYNGDIAHLADIPIPTADEPRYERVHRVLRRYDEHLTDTEREFLKLLSAFRTPVHESAFEKVFAPLLHLTTERTESTEKKKKGFFARLFNSESPDSPITNYQSPITSIVSRLVTYRILHCDTTSQTYTAHPLVRNHYLAILTHGDSTEQQDVHGKIKDYYLTLAGDTPQYPTLDDLKPLIEVVHHACQAGAYDEAVNIFWQRIYQTNSFVLTQKLGAYDTALSTWAEFFPNGDTSQELLVNDKNFKRFILNDMGLCLMSLGRLREAVPFYERQNKICLEMQDWHNLSITYQSLADLHARLGVLKMSAEFAHQALDFARRAENKFGEMISLVIQARTASFYGDLQSAISSFAQAEKIQQEIDSSALYLNSLQGVHHANHLLRVNQSSYARRVTEVNLRICEQAHWADDISRSHRLLGDLDFDSDNHESARAHYESALKIARSISMRHVLIEALLARGRFAAKVGATHPLQTKTPDGIDGSPVQDAFNDLNEALNYAVEGGYRIYEADIRVALGWAYLANGEKEKAKQSAQRALQMSQEMGYHWGKVDAEEILNSEL